MKKSYPRSFEEIAALVADTADFFAANGIDDSLRMKVDLSLEELFVNMVTYNTESGSDIEVEMKAIEGGIEISLIDHDVERFDPTIVREVDVDAPAADRSPGGLGLYLVLKMADSIHYEYHDRTSKITFTNRVTVGEREHDV